MTGVLMRRGEETQKHTLGRRPFEDGGIDWSDAPRSPGTPRIASNHRELGRRKDPSLEPSERAWPW